MASTQSASPEDETRPAEFPVLKLMASTQPTSPRDKIRPTELPVGLEADGVNMIASLKDKTRPMEQSTGREAGVNNFDTRVKSLKK
ncbi:hypothetical protein Taro_047745 [Colocasia esculenta]|uniref:Uncharacterized protein n=1 Tax=Colocasia esculenta TaxID=4460 RepID=A0A843X805_COLES|nr:hypothetical protein [Colocasia esculenta]